MAGFVTNMIQNSLSGFVSGAITTVGGVAGNAVGGVGNLIEGAGSAVGNGIAGKFDAVGSGINSYGTAARNATAPNSGSATAIKKTAVTKDSKPKPAGQKALPSSKPMKALPAPPAKKDVKTPYTPPYPTAKKEAVKALPAAVKKNVKTPYTPPSSVIAEDPAKNTRRGRNGKKKVTVDKQSLPGYSPATRSITSVANSGPKPAVPGYGYGASKAGSVAGSAKPALSTYGNNTANKVTGVVGSASKVGYKPPVSGYGAKAKSQAGSVAGSVAGGGPSFF